MKRLAVTAMLLAACGAADHEIDPGDLELRDLLGIDPSVAAGWSPAERGRARRQIEGGLAASAGRSEVAIATGIEPSQAAIAGMTAADERRAERGQPVLSLAAAALTDGRLRIDSVDGSGLSLDDPGAPEIALRAVDWDAGDKQGWSDLWRRAPALSSSLAAIAGAPAGTVVDLAPAPRAPFVAVYVSEPPTLLVNPVVYAALEPPAEPLGDPAAALQTATERPEATGSRPPGAEAEVYAGNPYAFFGSVAECAAAERLRCEACLPSSNCDRASRDAASGNEECETLAADDGVGYYLFCVNLSLAISTVADCTGDSAPSCPIVPTASNQISALDANRTFIDDPTCEGALDGCLAEIYGDPDDDFPGPPGDAGPSPTPPEPRDVGDVSCGETDCEFNPSCNASCDGLECGQLFSCNADCSGDGESGGDGGGGGGCDCEGEQGGSGSGGDGGCDSGSENSGSDSCDSGCDSGDSGGGGGGGSSGCDSGGSSSGGSSGCDSGGDCGGSSGGSCGSDCGSSGSCSVVARERAERAQRKLWINAVSVGWALAPLLVLGVTRRRRRKEGSR